MTTRLEWALMLTLLLGSLLVSLWVAPPAAQSVEIADPLSIEVEPTVAAQPAKAERDWLPSFDGFDAAGFGLLPDLAPRFAPGQP
ncbi:MAG: hypothetical protein MUE46_12565 [Xanthomonadales bacterium]|nr:hypothetical protein [Xanthomonadales bacterium]